jgi:hypothetical protein
MPPVGWLLITEELGGSWVKEKKGKRHWRIPKDSSQKLDSGTGTLIRFGRKRENHE